MAKGSTDVPTIFSSISDVYGTDSKAAECRYEQVLCYTLPFAYVFDLLQVENQRIYMLSCKLLVDMCGGKLQFQMLFCKLLVYVCKEKLRRALLPKLALVLKRGNEVCLVLLEFQIVLINL